MAITSAGSGNWNSTTPNAPWPSGTVPTPSDDVYIEENTDVALTSTDCVCKSLTLKNGTSLGKVGGILSCGTGADWKLTIEKGLTTTATSNPSNTATYTSSVLLDMSASAYTGQVVINNSRSTTAADAPFTICGNYTLKGASRVRHTVIESALTAGVTTSVYVTDATGWKVGDVIVFATTSAWSGTGSANCKTDLVLIDSITFDNAPTNTGRAQITWSESLAYAHASGCPAGNFTSNLIFRPGTGEDRSYVAITSTENQQSRVCVVDNVAFGAQISGTDYGLRSVASPGGVLFFSQAGGGNSTLANHSAITNCSFYQFYGGGLGCNYLSGGLYPVRSGSVFYSKSANSSPAVMLYNITAPYTASGDSNYCIFAAQGGITKSGSNQSIDYAGASQTNHKISGIWNNVADSAVALATNYLVSGCSIWSCGVALKLGYGVEVSDCDIGAGAFSGASNNKLFTLDGICDAEVLDCEFGTESMTLTSELVGTTETRKLTILNKNPSTNGQAVQEIYQRQSATVPAIQRKTDTVTRATSSLLFTVYGTAVQEHEFKVTAKAGETITILVYVMKSGTPSYGSSTLPKVTISGLGITPQVYTMDAGTAADAWELLTCTAENSGTTDGQFTVTLAAQSATSGAKAWFSGIPVAPFATRCRHYGKVFNEASITVVPDTLTSADEATAAAYSGMAITWGASSSTAITTSQTFQQLYDYHQSQAVLNVGSALALTGAGAAGSPALFAAGNVTVSDGAVLNGAGSIAMGSYTLSTEFAGGSNYSYTGGTWSQLATVPTFSGGQLNLGASGTYTFTVAASMIISMTPAAPGTYALGDCALSGTMDLRNTTAHAITVEVPGGTSYTTANNTGGTITVSEPQLYQTVTISGCRENTRIQLLDENSGSAGEELYNDIPDAFPFTWTDPDPAGAERSIRLRVGYWDQTTGLTADIFEDRNIGTCGLTEGTVGIAYVHAPEVDPTYLANATDGSAVLGITVDDALLRCRIAIGAITWAEIYAYNVYWLWTEEGIRDEGAYIDAPDPANYLVHDFKIINDTDPEIPLVISGGYGRSADTGTIADIIDTTGGSIFPQVDHVVSYATGDGPLTTPQAAQLNAIYSGVSTNLDAKVSDTAQPGDEMTLTDAYDPAKTAAQAGDAMTLTEAYAAAKTAAQAGDAMTLTEAYAAAKTAAQAGAAMTLTEAYDPAKTAAQPGDIPAAATNASAVRTELTSELAKIVDIHRIKGLDAAHPVTATGDGTTSKTVSADGIEIEITPDGIERTV